MRDQILKSARTLAAVLPILVLAQPLAAQDARRDGSWEISVGGGILDLEGSIGIEPNRQQNQRDTVGRGFGCVVSSQSVVGFKGTRADIRQRTIEIALAESIVYVPKHFFQPRRHYGEIADVLQFDAATHGGGAIATVQQQIADTLQVNDELEARQ